MKLTHREPVADEPVAWLAPTEDDTRYVVIAPDSNEAIKDLLCAFPVYTHPAAPQPAALPEPADKLREAAQKSLRIFDWLERRSIYQDAEVKEAHDLLRDALKGKQ